jgi:hypothetical protein
LICLALPGAYAPGGIDLRVTGARKPPLLDELVKAEPKRPLGRPGHRLENNIKIDIRETLWDGMDWIGVAQDRVKWRCLVDTTVIPRLP